jgi:hypothetical protein
MASVAHVAFKIYGIPDRAEEAKLQLPMARVEKGVVVLASALPVEAALNDHIVWIGGMLKHERRMLKRLVTMGASLVCECKVSKGELRLKANAFEFLHLVGADLVLMQR